MQQRKYMETSLRINIAIDKPPVKNMYDLKNDHLSCYRCMDYPGDNP